MCLSVLKIRAILAAWVVVALAAMAGARGAGVTWEQIELGNIFDAGQPVRLAFQADAEAIEWVVYDFWHSEVARGRTPIDGGRGEIQPDVSGAGYYLLHATPVKDGKPLADAYTSFAIVRPHVSPDPANSRFGVMTHFAQGMNPKMLPAFKRIGIQSIRDEHYWAQVERTKGVYEFSDRSNSYMQACREAGIDPLIAMTFGNKHYDHAEGPTTPQGYAGYGRYGQAILQQYGDQIRWVEIWNEYNGTWCPPAARNDRPKYYTEMLKVAYEHIKSVRPDVQVLGGAAVLIPLPYFEGIFQRGGLDYMDGVVIHPYRSKPEGVDQEIQELKALIRKYNNGQDKPIWVTETGRHTKDEYGWEAGRKMYEKGRAEGARYLARMYTLLLKEDVARIYWYLASDHANFVSMGLLRHHQKEESGMGEYAVAPAYVAYANLIHQLDGATFVRREAERPYTRMHVYLFRRGEHEIRVCWATQPAQIRITADQPITLINLMGGETTLAPEGGQITIDLGEDAIYLIGTIAGIEEVDTGVRVIAASRDDYSKTQGQNGWSYGYFIDGDSTFHLMQQVETMWGYKWGGPAKYLSISDTQVHPDRISGKDAMPALRWTSPVNGHLTIQGHIHRGDRGDGVIAVLLVDGREIFSQTVGGSQPQRVELDLPVRVKEGSTIDLVVKPGKSIDFDATEFELRMIQQAGK